ncbi:MAG: OsmC family protein [Myxococcaceae bacterium]|nr:OsmC family protein [Myxococcaceae bacterium]
MNTPQPSTPAPTADTAAAQTEVPVAHFEVKLRHERGFRFRADFDGEQHPPLWFDEPPPLGNDTAPNPARVLAAAIGDCLAASLRFSLQKAKVDLESLDARVHVELVRNAQRRLRIGRVRVQLNPTVGAQHRAALEQALTLFEDFCIVTQSVRDGIAVEVAVGP